MNTDRDKLVKEIFADALEKANAAERAAYLTQACGNDAQLRQQVEALLLAHEKAGGFLEEPAAALPGNTIVVPTPLTEKPGDRIGPYKLLQQIGEGGCGVVYMAEQEQPIRRRVALKVIKLGMDTKAVIARFEAERQALALMDHPNIAKVLDAGATDTGRPYFVMELVRGIKITDYCDQNNLSTDERLDLFVQICHAVQHAHQKGIIHRDIKPSNILVTVHDGKPLPKIIDFGIAKATSGQVLTDKTMFTAFEQFIGTPAYMSPEQAEMSTLDIDTRSDIYALGVLLYELLTGRTPLDQKELLAAGLSEMRRIIREEEPPRPSTRLSTLTAEERTMVAKRRQAGAPALIHLVRGDLDWIVMKCLEKDRTRRYETANGLANDIERHLTNNPVLARPPSPGYKLQRFVHRNRLAVAAATLVFAALAMGLGTSTYMYIRERQALLEQTRLRIEAEKARAAEASARASESTARAAETVARVAVTNAQAVAINARAEVQIRLDIVRAENLVKENKFSEAEELFDKIEPAYLAGDASVRACRLELVWHSCLNNDWNEIVKQEALVVRDDGPGWNRTIAGDHVFYAIVLIYAGRTAEYENLRRSWLKRFATRDDPLLSEYLCDRAMSGPADEEIRKGIARHYEVTKDRVRIFEGTNQFGEFPNLVAMAMTEYRLGDFQRAAQHSDRALSLPFRYSFDIPKTAALRAMALHQLKENDDARLTLAFCHQHVDAAMKKGPSVWILASMGMWLSWLGDADLQREADALIGAPSADDYGRLAQARAKLNTAEKFGTNRLFYLAAHTEHDSAQQTADETPVILQRTDGTKFVSLLRALGLWELQRHQWREALTNWSLVIYGPSGRGSLLYGQDLSRFYLSFAPLLVELDDGAGYERFRTNALATFGGTAVPTNAARILEACLLRPPDEKQMPALKELATILPATPGSSNGLPAGDLTLALFKFRSGDPLGALELARTNLDAAGRDPTLAAKAGVLRALCLARLGRLDEAQVEVDAVRETIENKFNSPPISQSNDLESWHEWWVGHILLQEAQASLRRSTDGSGSKPRAPGSP